MKVNHYKIKDTEKFCSMLESLIEENNLKYKKIFDLILMAKISKQFPEYL